MQNAPRAAICDFDLTTASETFERKTLYRVQIDANLLVL